MIIQNDAAKFSDLKPAKYGFLTRLEVAINDCTYNYSNFDISILLSTTFNEVESGKKLLLRFKHTSDIKIGDLSMTGSIYVGIINIRDRGLEGVTFLVSDQEAGTFAFGCTDFSAEIIE